MKIAIPKERRAGEARVAASPDTVKKYVQMGFEVVVETGAGDGASIADSVYQDAGATIAADAAVSDSRFGISVSPTGTTDANSQVVFPIEVSKVTLLSNITPGSYTVGTLTFSAGGSANAVVTVILQVTP